MGSNALEVSRHDLPVRPQTAVQIRAQVNLIQEVMQAVMKKDTHYGVIPGCQKPSLYKPGSEKLLSTFRIAIEPIVEDLSTSDSARYRVVTRATSSDGTFLGSGIGEASSDEEKYKWREAVCDQEFESFPADRKRMKFKKGPGGRSYTVNQVRTEKADIANTILKMAKKRSQIDVTLTVTAASDIFTQDIEDLPEELQREEVVGDGAAAAPKPSTPVAMPQRKSPEGAPTQTQPAQASPTAQQPPRRTYEPESSTAPTYETITVPQSRRFFGLCMGNGLTKPEMKEYLKREFGIDDDRQMPKSGYEKACAWAARGGK